MSEPRTTITYCGKQYPFYKTNRGTFDFENAGFSNAAVLEGKQSALLALTYFHMRDCARRAGTPITDSFEEFIDKSDPDVTDVFIRLNEERLKQSGNDKQKEETEPKKD